MISLKRDIDTNATPQNIELNGANHKPDDATKLELRAKKFGTQLDSSKLESRAKRFGADVVSVVSDKNKDEKLEKRVKRFGIVNLEKNKADDDLMQKRKKKFMSTDDTKTDEKLMKRKLRFGDADDDVKKKLRSERFEKN